MISGLLERDLLYMRRKKVNKKNKCLECGESPEDRDSGGMYKHKKYDVRLAKEFCEDEGDTEHKLTPIWKKCCGTLDYYLVEILKFERMR